MAVKAIGAYVGVPRDLQENFGGKQLVYANWDRHLLFAAPFLLAPEPEMTFADLINGPFAALIGPDPDSKMVDFRAAQWLLSGDPFEPKWDASLAENGITHKRQLTMVTPRLNSLCGAMTPGERVEATE